MGVHGRIGGYCCRLYILLSLPLVNYDVCVVVELNRKIACMRKGAGNLLRLIGQVEVGCWHGLGLTNRAERPKLS